VACEGLDRVWGGSGGELVATNAMLPSMGGGVKPGMAYGVLGARRCVPEHAGDELMSVQRQGLAAVVTVIGVAEADGVAGEFKGATSRQWPAADVAGQIESDSATVCIGFADLDVPVQPVVAGDGATPMEFVLLGWQVHQSCIQSAREVGEELAAEQVLQRLERDECY
jgi:hypothetical protein